MKTFSSLLFLFFLSFSFVASDCGTTPFHTPIQLVGYECIGPPSVYVDPVTEIVYASCYWGFYSCSDYYQNDCYNVIAIQGTNITRIANSSQCVEPNGIYGGSNGMVYVACSAINGGTANIISINSTSLQVAQIVSSDDCTNPYDVFVDGNTLYAACWVGNVISVSLVDNSVTILATPDQCSYSYSVFELSGTVYVSCSGGQGQIVTITGGVVTQGVDQGLCGQPSGVVVSAIDDTIYASCQDGLSGVVAISSSGTATTIISVDQCTYSTGVALSSTDVLYVACEYQDTLYYTGSTIAVAVPHSECNPYYPFFNSNTGILYLTCAQASSTTDMVVKANPCV
jgi:hypothetical protein